MVGRTFEAKLAQDVSVRGNVLLKAGSKAFGKIATSRYNPRKNDPLTVVLTPFRERPQRGGENECVPAWEPADDGASGALRIYSRHAGDYPRNPDAVPASSLGDVVVRLVCRAVRSSTPRLCDGGSRGGRHSEI